jgi:lysine 6-dehydrogenase
MKPVEVKGQTVVPRDVFIAAVSPRLHKPQGRDLVALQVLVAGLKDGTPREVGFRLIDYFDVEHGISAMMRTTGYSLSITGQMQADGRITQKGVRTSRFPTSASWRRVSIIAVSGRGSTGSCGCRSGRFRRYRRAPVAGCW